MKLEIITPEKILYSASISVVTIPGTLGDFGVLAGHAPFISTIRPGIISVEAEGKTQKLAIMGGIAEVMPDRCIVLADGAIDVTELTPAFIETKTEEANDELANAKSDSQKQLAETKRQFAEVLRLAAA